MRKIHMLWCSLVALMTCQLTMAQVVVPELPDCDNGGSGYYYVISCYDQLTDGQEMALALTDDYDVVVKPLDRTSKAQIFRIVATTNNGNPTTGGGSPRYRFYSSDKTDDLHGLQGTANNDPNEKLYGTTYTMTDGNESSVAICSMRTQEGGYTIAMNNRTGKLIVPQNFQDGAQVFLTNNVMDNVNNTCQVWRFEAISADVLAEIDPEAAENYYFDQVLLLYQQLTKMGGVDDSGLPHLNGGTMFGFYPTETADFFNDVMLRANAIIESGEVLEQATLIQLFDELTTLKAKMDEGVIEVTDGYYYLISAYDKLNALGTDPDAQRYEMVAYPLTNQIGWTYTDPNFRDNGIYIWKFAKREDGMWDITNFNTEEAFAAWNGGNRIATLTRMDITADDQANQRKAYQPFGLVYNGQGGVAICLNGNTGNKFYPRNAGQPFGEQASDEMKLEMGNRNRGFTNESGRYWYLERVDESKIEGFREAAANEARAKVFAERLNDEIIKAKTSVLAAYTLDLTNARDVTPTDQMAFNSNSGQNCDHGNTWDEENGVCLYGTEGGGYAALIDDNNGTFFHTASGSQFPVLDDQGNNGQPWLSAELPESVSNITFAFYRRENVNDWATPNSIAVDVSNDGITWTEVSKPYAFYDAENYDKNNPTYAGPFDLGGSYKFVRFRSFATRRHDGNNNYFNIGGIKYFTDIALAAGAQASIMPAELVKGLSDALGYAVAEQKDNTYANWDDLNKASEDLAAALAAFKTAFVDPSKLEELLPEARTLIANFSTDDEFVGSYSDDAVADRDALKAVIDKYDGIMNGSDPTVFTVEIIDDLVGQLQDAENNLNSKIRMPEEGKWYQIYFGSEEEWAEQGWDVLEPRNLAGRDDAMVDDPENVETVWNLFERYMAFAVDYEMADEPLVGTDAHIFSIAEDAISGLEDYSYFRFIPVGENGLYAIQNKATGLYVGPAAGTNGDIMPSLVPGLYSIKNAGPGFVTLRSHDFQTEEAHPNTIHFRRSEYGVCAFTDGVNNQGSNTKSALHVKAATDLTAEPALSVFAEIDVPTGYVLPGGVTATDVDAKLYSVSGKFVNEGITFVALKQRTSINPGEPFLLIGAEKAELTTSTSLVQKPDTVNNLVGTYTSYTVANGNLAPAFLEEFFTDEEGNTKSYFDEYDLNLYAQFSLINGYDNTTDKVIAPGHAYLLNLDDLPVVDATEADDFIIVLEANINGEFQPLTRILDLNADKLSDSQLMSGVYNLQGQRVASIQQLDKLPRGIYIINGKKVMKP